jgi:predicted kinase
VKRLYMMFGLPASGKSSWIKERDLPYVSADEIKESYSDYDKRNPQQVHERSVKAAEEEFDQRIKNSDSQFCLDGGGINNSYTQRMVRNAKENGWSVVLVHIDTPLAVCIQRNAERDRNVPVEDMIGKAVRLQRCLETLTEQVDEVITESYYTHKHVFFDMDGTVAAYQFLPKSLEGGINFVDGEYFRHAKPVPQMIAHAKGFAQISELFVLSAIPDATCCDEKREWLAKNCPFIPVENQYFIGNKRYKHEMLRNVLRKRKINTKDVLVVDDDHAVLDDLNSIGVHAVHPSMFLCMGR